MALQSFKVENQKALRLGECDDVPPIMIIAGPNGAGKSTLLYALHRRDGAIYDEGSVAIYQPPHRAIRRQQVRRRFLGGVLSTLQDILAGSELSGFEGLNFPFPARAPDNVDEAGSTIKYTLGRIENRRQALITSLLDEHRKLGQSVDAPGLPNVYEPLQRLVSHLLPHLAFVAVDFKDEDNIRCLFNRTDVITTDQLDLDDLSSGEKSIILLFLPLIENDINGLLAELEKADAREDPTLALPDRVFLIDEPEQHLWLRDAQCQRPPGLRLGGGLLNPDSP